MKRHNDPKLILLLLITSLWISACNSRIRSVPLVTGVPLEVTPTLTTQVIAIENVESLIEVKRLVADNAGPVAALTFTPNMQTLLVAYAHEGILRHWSLVDSTLLNTLNTSKLNLIGLGGASFDARAELLATSAGAEWGAHRFDDTYSEYQVWNTQTGEVINQSPKDPKLRFFYPDIQLNPEGNWLLLVSMDSDGGFQGYKPLDIRGIPRGGVGQLLLDTDTESEEFDFDIIAFDSSGEFFAAANEAGKMAIYPFDKANPFGPPATVDEAYAIIEPGNIDKPGPTPLALAFDPTRHWLARVRGTELVVWDLQSADYQRQLDALVGEVSGITASLAFNPGGELLGVGTANGWQIWNVITGELVASGTDVEVYAVAFSPDGRLFVWGDSAGEVHVWGVPEE